MMNCKTENVERLSGRIHTVLGLCLLLIFVSTASAQVTGGDDPGLPDLPPPSTAGVADPATNELDVEADADLNVEGGNKEDALPLTSGAIIDSDTKIRGETDADETIEADVQPQLGDVPRRRRPAASADVDSSADVDFKHRGKLGAYVSESNNRVTIRDVMSGGAAAHVGLEAGDEILSVNGRRITTSAQLRTNLRTAADENGSVTILINRNGDIHTIEADVSGRFVAEAANDRLHTYYRGPYGEAPVNAPHSHWYLSWPHYTWYGAYPRYYPAYPYYYGYYGYYGSAPVGYYCW